VRRKRKSLYCKVR